MRHSHFRARLALTAAMVMSGLLRAEAQTTVFQTDDDADFLYRIPCISRLHDGSLLAISDKRIGHGAQDLGEGNGIDIVARRSADGRVWSPMETILKSDSTALGYAFAYGDCSSVVDRESGKIMLTVNAGRHGFFAEQPIGNMMSLSDDGGSTWRNYDLSPQLYQDTASAKHIFVSSGRMIQSSIVKKGAYYRVYAALNTRIKRSNAQRGNGGSRVAYSDDFGQTWHYLGGTAVMPAEAGDECKVEELPGGNIVLSCRVTKGCGRYFNLFTFSNIEDGIGSWQEPVRTGSEDVMGEVYGNSCNGELLLVPARRTADGQREYVLLQSLPADKWRKFVTIYWKPIGSQHAYESASDFVKGWRRYLVSTSTSAYSTMDIDAQGNVAFLYEEHLKNAKSGYDIQFSSIPLSEITHGAYRYAPTADDEYHPTAEPR